MKKFRSSFNHLIREKVLAGQNDNTPSPEQRDLTTLFPGLVANVNGKFEYQVSSSVHTTGSNTWNSQGPMGYGSPPVGSGATPYKSFLSNKTEHSTANVYTGSADGAPSITFKGLSHTGLGATFAVGTASQYVITTNDTKHAYTPGREHVLATIYGIHHTGGSHVAGTGDYDDASNGAIQFCYKNVDSSNGKGFSLYLNVVDETGTEVEQGQGANIHFYTPYSRLMPVAIGLSANGGFEFRADNAKISGNVTSLVNKAGSSLDMPGSGELALNISGLQTTPFTSPYTGIDNPVSRLTNVAVNDNDDSDGKGDIGVPPFVVGIPCTPIRYSGTIGVGDDKWNLPLQVVDPQSGWIPFSDTSPTVAYGLSAVADSQLFETRGVAASAENSPLHVYTANRNTLDLELSGRGLTGLTEVEAINSIVYESTVLENDNDMTLTVTENGSYTPITAEKVFSGIKDDFANSHVSHFYDKDGNPLDLNDFNNGLVLTLKISG